MTREEQEKARRQAARFLIRDLNKMIEKTKKKKENIKFSVTIDGDEYNTENEVLDSYGAGFITSSQKDTAIRKFEAFESGSTIYIEDCKIRLLDELIRELSQVAIEPEEKEEK